MINLQNAVNKISSKSFINRSYSCDYNLMKIIEVSKYCKFVEENIFSHKTIYFWDQ